MTSSPTEPITIGCDPSIRHTGLCFLRGAEAPVYHEIQTGKLDVTEANRELRLQMEGFLQDYTDTAKDFELVLGIERQMAQAAVNGWLMMVSMVAVCEAVQDRFPEVRLVAPYPNQLKAYISGRYRVKTGTKTQIRNGHRKLNGGKLVSSHKAEAWFLAKMAGDVLAGNWSYNQSPTKPDVFPWPIMRGE